MGKYSTKLKRALAMVLTFVMVVSVLTVAPSTEASAAASKYVKSFSVKKSAVSMTVGQTTNVKTTIKVKGSASKKFTVKSSDKAVATVKASGSKVKITAKAAGTATITVKTKGAKKNGKKITKKIKVTVTGATAPTPQPTVVNATGVSVNVTPSALEVGGSAVATAVVVPANATNKDVVWSSSDVNVAKVDAVTGIVTAVYPGAAVITATTTNGVRGSATIVVNAVTVTGVNLDRSEIEVDVADTARTLTATVVPANATDKRLTWSISDPKVAKIDGTGETVKIIPLEAGEAVITVTTNDGAKVATANVKVTDNSKKDVDGMDVKVTNALEGHPNTLLVGSQAKISIKVTKDGTGYQDAVNARLMGVAGYTDYYELSRSDVDTNAEGVATLYVRLKDAYSKKGPILSSWGDAAYASFDLELVAGGANYTEKISLSFAQVVPETMDSSVALSVENQRDPSLKEIEVSDLYSLATDETLNVDKYAEEYVVNQQVTSDLVDDADHKVVLDAAPTLILPATLGKSDKNMYVADKITNPTCSEYSVYSGIEKATTIADVPGGLKYLTLYFKDLKLSAYSRIIVRAYEAGTSYPLVDNYGDLIQKIITPDTVISSSTVGKTVQVEEEVFNETTSAYKNIDIKIFVESPGQVNENSNVGYSLTGAEGPWANQEVKLYDYERLAESVTWECGSTSGKAYYTGEESLPDPEAYMGKNYDPNNTYKYAVPHFPGTGNAIIVVYDRNGQIVDYYMYPTVAEGNANVLDGKVASRTFHASVEQVKELEKKAYSATVGADGRLTIDSKDAGYVPVTASINFGDEMNPVKYDLNSSVQWSPIPDRVLNQAKPFYALAGQTITIKAIVTDKNGNKKSDAKISWDGLVIDDGVTITSSSDKTNSMAEATLVLSASDNADVPDLTADAGKDYYVTLYVAGTEVKTGHAELHWVKPGIFYQRTLGDAIDDNVYNTSAAEADVTTVVNNYVNSNTWIIGTKVVGASADPARRILNISNIKINMSTSSAENVPVTLTEVENGVCTVYTDRTGRSMTTAEIAGLIDDSKKCVITVEEYDRNDPTKVVVNEYTCVGEGPINKGSDLIIPIDWGTNGEELSIVNNNAKFDINNPAVAKVYIKVTDKSTAHNLVSGVQVDYKVTDKDGNIVVDKDDEYVAGTATTVDGMIVIDVPTPVEATTYTVSANITNNSADPVTTTVNFTDDNDAYTITDVNTSDVDNQKIYVTFSHKVDLTAILVAGSNDGFFDIMDGTNKIDIDNIEVDPKNNARIIITPKATSTFTSNAKVSVKSTVTKGVMVYYLIDSNGVLYSEK